MADHEEIKNKFSELLDTPIDWFNIQERIDDIWLFLTNDKMPPKASIKREVFNHELNVMLQGLLFNHNKKECIELLKYLKGQGLYRSTNCEDELKVCFNDIKGEDNLINLYIESKNNTPSLNH